MRTPLIVTTTLLIVVGAATAEESAGQCGTVLTIEGAAVREMQAQHGAYTLGVQPRYTLDVPLAIHIVRESDGSGGYDPNDLPTILSEANSYWLPTGMQFFQTGSVDFIDDDDFYFNIDTLGEINELRQTNPVANAVNVYFTANLAYEDGGLCGISSFTWSEVQGIVLQNSCADPGDTTFPHEVGHYFDLLHTHETVHCVECPDGSNCTSCGDQLCDTPADPGLRGHVSANYICHGGPNDGLPCADDSDCPDGSCGPDCVWDELTCDSGADQGRPCWVNGDCEDGSCTADATPPADCGSASYVPDTLNMMSYSQQTCRRRFSVEEQDLALATLINLRPGLISEPGLQVTWVDFNAPTNGDGSYGQPFNNLNHALVATDAGGTIVFMAGSTAGMFTINQDVTLDAFRGTVTIGQ